MKYLQIGVSAHRNLSRSTLDKADFIEIKKITPQEVLFYQQRTDKPLLFHLQYSGDDRYYLPTAVDFNAHLNEISSAYELARPRLASFHFGLSSASISMDSEHYVAVAESRLLEKDEIVQNMEKNLMTLKEVLQDTLLLVENLEFIPEILSKGAYRYIQEVEFFTHHVRRWNKMGILEGIVFDIAHGLITAGNHPYYNGLAADPLNTDFDYLESVKSRNNLLEYFGHYIAKMPLSLIKEIHISGIKRLKNGVWVDAHSEIGEIELKGLKILLNSIEDIEDSGIPVTLEYFRDIKKLEKQLDQLRDFNLKGS